MSKLYRAFSDGKLWFSDDEAYELNQYMRARVSLEKTKLELNKLNSLIGE